MSGPPYYIGVDVGTGSVRAALVSASGDIVCSDTQEITIWEPRPGYFQQSSQNIWNACVKTVKEVISKVSNKADIRGVGFDATCSLVVLDEAFQPISVCPDGSSGQDIVMWMDHRAEKQADSINATNHPVLKYVGGKQSLEMQTPKLLWLKQNMKESVWDKAGHFLDLGDFLTWKATGSLARSLCSLVCKCSYVASSDKPQGAWDDTFFAQVGLQDLVDEGYKRLGALVGCPGDPCGTGMISSAAQELGGLQPNTPVAMAMIDAHAGGIGCLGCSAVQAPVSEKLALIMGTSSCFMGVNESALFVPGVWGPYYSAMVPGMWLSEGGQSATGKLMDHVIMNHAAYDTMMNKKNATEELRKMSSYAYLNSLLSDMAKDKGCDLAELTQNLHVWPDFHGNRSPLADPTLKGMISGLSLSSGVEDLSLLYLGTLQALVYGTKLTIDAMSQAGHKFSVLIACGGISKNPLFVQTVADVMDLDVVLPEATESVLLGAAMLGACASKDFPSIQEAMAAMGGGGKVIHPNKAAKRYHEKKFCVFEKMLSHQREYSSIMSS